MLEEVNVQCIWAGIPLNLNMSVTTQGFKSIGSIQKRDTRLDPNENLQFAFCDFLNQSQVGRCNLLVASEK